MVFTGWVVVGSAENITSLFFGRMISAIAVTCHMSSIGIISLYLESDCGKKSYFHMGYETKISPYP